MPALNLTDVQIQNLALIKLGEEVATVQTSTKYANLMAAFYELTRQEEIRSYNWIFAKRRVQVQQAQVTTNAVWMAASSTMQVGTTVGMIAGWLVSSILIQGGGQVSFPPGIPSGTTILSITDGTHIVMSNAATAGGSGQLVFQVNNLTGYWFAYVVPYNLRGIDIYAVFPNYTFVWPFKIQNIVEFGFINEAGYIYTNLDPGNGNPIMLMLVDPGPANYPPDFIEMLSCRLAMKMWTSSAKRSMKDLTEEYGAMVIRAQGNDNEEATNDELGPGWWVDDRRGGH